VSEERKEAIRQALAKRALDGRIPCARALALAKELGVSAAEVGEAANEMKIKITACQLGCFK